MKLPKWLASWFATDRSRDPYCYRTDYAWNNWRGRNGDVSSDLNVALMLGAVFAARGIR